MGMRYESPVVHRDGHEYFVEVSLTALRRGDGYIVNAFVRDITQRRAAEEQLIQAQKMESVGQLTGGIAHDFNNMLTVITGTIEILADGVKDMPHLATIAKLISDAADRGAQLTASLLAFARKQPLQPAEIDVNALIREIVRLLSPTLGQHIEITTALARRRVAGLRRSEPAQLSARQSRDQCPRRDADRRNAGLCQPAMSNWASLTPWPAASNAPATTSPSKSATPGPALRSSISTGFSIRSFPPRRLGKAPGSGSAWCSASSSSRAAVSRSIARRERVLLPDLASEGRS